MEPIRFTIEGDPRTKKNHQQIAENKRTGQKFIMQARTATDYEQAFLWQVPGFAKQNLQTRVNVKCVFFMQTRRRVDLVNLLENVCDCLTRAGVIADDNANVVAGHDGSRVRYDKERPRVEIEIGEIWEE